MRQPCSLDSGVRRNDNGKEAALIELVRARLECSGPVTVTQLAELFEDWPD